jgi:hypothetical protein
MTDGGLAISGGRAVGTSSSRHSGDIRVGEDYGSNQYSQIVLTSTQLTPGQWVGPTVRSQNGGQDTYLGIYFWASGGPELELFKRSGGTFSQIGNSYPVAPLPAGTVLTLVAVGSQISLLENGIERITATDNTITGGNPGLMTYGTPGAASWTGDDATATNPALQYSVGGTVTGLSGSVVLQDNGGDDLTLTGNGPFTFPTGLANGAAYNVTVKTQPAGETCTIPNPDGTISSTSVTDIAVSCTLPGGSDSPMQVTYQGTNGQGIASYAFTSAEDGYGTHVLRVLSPTDPTPGVPHNFLYVLPGEPEQGTTYGDGLGTMLSLNAQNQYNLTIIEPSFAIDPWYANNTNDPNLQYQTFITQDLVPWVQHNFGGTGGPAGGGQNWLIGFSKSGLGAQDLLLKFPQLFSLAASWDFPADMSSYAQFGSSSENEYGTNANFQTNYQLTPSFLNAHKAPFLNSNRIWIGGYNAFQTDIADYDALLTSTGIEHTTEAPQQMAHRWDSGWVQIALAALSQDSAAVVAVAVPSTSGAPSISGSVVEGQKLSGSHASWSGSPTGYSYQWQSCDASGGNCSAIQGATSQSYTLTSAEVGHTIQVQETASNAGGSSAPAISAQTSTVQAQYSDGAGTTGSVGGGTGVTTGGSDSSGTAGGATGTSSSGTGGDPSSANSSRTGDRPSGTTSRGSARAVPTFGRVTRSAAGASLSVACRGSRGSSCTFSLRLTLKGKGTALGSRSVRLAVGHPKTVTIRLNRTAKRLLNQHHKLTAKFTVIQNRATILQKVVTF